MRIVRLDFQNATAETDQRVCVSISSIDAVLAWYGSYYAGDDYTVTLDGRPVDIDHNGEVDHGTIDAEVV